MGYHRGMDEELKEQSQADVTIERPGLAEVDGGLGDELLVMYQAVQDFAAGTDNDPLWVIGEHPSMGDLQEAASNGALFVLRVDGLLAGALVADRNAAPGYEAVAWQQEASDDELVYLHIYATHPNFRGRGLGRQLLEQAEATLYAEGARVMRLDTLVDNLGAQATYNAMGYTFLGRANLNYGPGPYANDPAGGFVVFEKALGQ